MKPIEPTIQLGRMRIHKVHEMDSPVPLLSQLPGTTEADMRRLLEWYDQPDEVNPDPETSFMTFSVHSWVIELDGQPVTNVRIGGVSYTPAQVGRIDGDIKMSDVQPFVGLGYDSTFTRTSRIGLKAVLGMAFSDTPEVTLRASGGTLSTNAVFLENVRAEEADIAEDSKDFKYFPVAQVGLSYRF